MSLIKKPHELKTQFLPSVLIYGQIGTGKTTLALSSPSPLLFDFDNGIHRVDKRHLCDTVQIDSWQNMIDVLNNEDLTRFKTFVIDTAGKMLDYMGAWIIKNNPKMGKANGALSLQGYGERKAEFRNFLKRIRIMGKSIVFVAHDMEEKDGDQKIIRPEIGGSSGSDLVKDLDLVGYIEMIGNQRTISFDPCEKYYGKNTCGLEPKIKLLDVVNGGNPNDFLSKTFVEYQNNLEKRRLLGVEYLELMQVIEGKIEAIETPEDADEVSNWAKEFKGHIWDSLLQVRTRFTNRIKELGFVINKETKLYELKKEETKA
jgi:hypothetical protein